MCGDTLTNLNHHAFTSRLGSKAGSSSLFGYLVHTSVIVRRIVMEKDGLGYVGSLSDFDSSLPG